MKKLPVVLCALFVLSAGPAFAQKGLVTATRALRQGFIGVPKALVKVNARGFFAVSKPFSAKAFKTPDAVRLSAVNLGVRESLRVSAQYQAHLKTFLEIKKEMDIFLGYQKLEPQHISAFEVHSRMNDLAQAEKELAAMERIVGPKEAGIHLGRSYLYQARMALQPNYASLYSKTEEKPTNSLRSFNADQFLLKDPDGTSLTMKDTSPGSDGFIRARQMAAELPEMTIAVLNDDPEILEWARDWNARGFFGAGSRMRIFNSLERFMDIVKDIKYDVVLIDYVLEDGVSLAAVDCIRQTGASTVILLNSAPMDNEVPAEKLFERGADGFVSSVGFRADNGGARIANALYNYMQIHGRAALTPHS